LLQPTAASCEEEALAKASPEMFKNITLKSALHVTPHQAHGSASFSFQLESTWKGSNVTPCLNARSAMPSLDSP
jgi:hypothetical protein